MDKYQICSAAMIKLDRNSISRFRDGRKEGEVAGQLYPPTKLAALQRHTWDFNTRMIELNRENATPTDVNFQYQFSPPGEPYLRLIRYQDRSGRKLRREEVDFYEGRVKANVTRLLVRYQRDLDERNYPAYFLEYLIAKLRYEFCEPMNGEGAVRQALDLETDKKFRRAVRIDTGQRGSPIGFRPVGWDRVRFR